MIRRGARMSSIRQAEDKARKAIGQFLRALSRVFASGARRVATLASRALRGSARLLQTVWQRLRPPGWRPRLRPLFEGTVGLVFVVVSLWGALVVLPVKGVPTTSPPAVAAELPDQGLHTTSNGYVLSLVLGVKSCSGPVHAYAQIILPKQYYTEERSGAAVTLKRALVGIGIDDAQVKMVSITQAGWQQHRQFLALPHWQVGFDDTLLVGGTGRADALRVDDWAARPAEVDAWFTAKWLTARGYRSCWLRLPSLTGHDVPLVADHAADAIDTVIGPHSGATNTDASSSASGTYHFCRRDGSVQTYHDITRKHVDYVDGDVPPSMSYITLATPMSIVPGASTAPPPSLGTPRWTCRAPAHQTALKLENGPLDAGAGGIGYIQPPTEGEFSTASSFDCSGIVALAEPGSQSIHDLLLLLIGAGISLGGGLILDGVLDLRRRDGGATADAEQAENRAEPAPPTPSRKLKRHRRKRRYG